MTLLMSCSSSSASSCSSELPSSGDDGQLPEEDWYDVWEPEPCGVAALVAALRDTSRSPRCDVLKKIAVFVERSPFDRELFLEFGGLPPLVELLRHGLPDEMVAAVSALERLFGIKDETSTSSNCSPAALSFVSLGGVVPLVALLRESSANSEVGNLLPRASVVATLAGVMAGDASGPAAVYDADGIKLLVGLTMQTEGRGPLAAERYGAASCLAFLAHDNSERALAIVAEGGIPALVDMVRDGTNGEKWRAAQAIAELAGAAPAAAESVVDVSGVPALVRLARGNSAEQRVFAAQALSNIVHGDVPRALAVAKAGGVKAVVKLATEGSIKEKTHATQALVGLAGAGALNASSDLKALVKVISSSENPAPEAAAIALLCLVSEGKHVREALVEAGGVAPLVALARRPCGGQASSCAAHALARLPDDDESRQALSQLGIASPVELLVKLLRVGDEQQKGFAAWSIANLAGESVAKRKAFIRAGSIDRLKALLRVEGVTECCREQAERALSALLCLDVSRTAEVSEA